MFLVFAWHWGQWEQWRLLLFCVQSLSWGLCPEYCVQLYFLLIPQAGMLATREICCSLFTSSLSLGWSVLLAMSHGLRLTLSLSDYSEVWAVASCCPSLCIFCLPRLGWAPGCTSISFSLLFTPRTRVSSWLLTHHLFSPPSQVASHGPLSLQFLLPSSPVSPSLPTSGILMQ